MIEGYRAGYSHLNPQELTSKLDFFQERLNPLWKRFSYHLKTEHNGAMIGKPSKTCHTCINLQMMIQSYEDRMSTIRGLLNSTNNQ